MASTEIKIYAGPSLYRWGLHHGSTYRDTLPATVQAAIEKCPAVRDLIVPVSRYMSARADIARKGTLLNARCAAVLAGLSSTTQEG